MKEECLLYFLIVFFVIYLLIIRMWIFPVFFLALFVGRLISKVKPTHIIFVSALLLLSFSFEVYKNNRTRIQVLRPAEYGDVIDWVNKNTEPDDVILTSFELGPGILAYTGRPIVLHSKFESALIREKCKRFIFAIYGNEKGFYDLSHEFQADYYIYQMPIVINDSKESDRYITNNLILSTDTVAYKFQFEPEKLRYFTLLYQNSYYRIYRIHAEGENITAKPRYLYQPIFDKQLFEDGTGLSSTFDDDRAKKVLRNLYQPTFHKDIADKFYREGKIDTAIIEYNRAISLNPFYADARYGLGNCY